MTETKQGPRFTPQGGWTVGTLVQNDGSIAIRSAADELGDFRRIARVDDVATDEGAANARLIAAAPELLHAALDVLGDLELFVSRQGPGPDGRLATLYAAIDKATGRKR